MSAYRELLEGLTEEVGAPSHLLLEPDSLLPDLHRTPGPGGLVAWPTSDRDLAELLTLQARAHDAIDEVSCIPTMDGLLVVARVSMLQPSPASRTTDPDSDAAARPATSAERRQGVRASAEQRVRQEKARAVPDLPSARPSVRSPAAPRNERTSSDSRPVAGATLEDLDPLLLARLGPDPVTALVELGGVRRYGRATVPAVAAMLALGLHPATLILGSPLIATDGTEPLRLLGSLPTLLRALDGWPPVERSAATARLLVLTAALTRDWSEDAEAVPTHLEVGATGIEVRFPRTIGANPVLRALVERLGLPGDPEAELQRAGGRVRRSSVGHTTRLWVPWPALAGKRPYVAREAREDALLEHLRTHGDRSTRELVGALGWSRSVVRAVLASLVEDGRVEGTSPGRQAPGQRYRVTDRA